MVLLGVIVNVIAIIVGTIIGLLFTRIKEEMKQTILKAIGITVVVIGIGMSLQAELFLLVLFSLAIGGAMGEWLRIEHKLESMGEWIQSKVGSNKGQVAKAFVSTTLIYCVGAMAIIGSLNSGLNLDHDVLYTKSFLDGFIAIVFASTLGIGVIFSAIPVFLFQGGIALLAQFVDHWLTPELIDRIVNDITATGGILIIGIGLNLLEITKIKVGNLLPALLVAVLLSIGYFFFF